MVLNNETRPALNSYLAPAIIDQNVQLFSVQLFHLLISFVFITLSDFFAFKRYDWDRYGEKV